MATFSFLFVSLIILSLTSTALANTFLENSCSKTRYPTECLQTLTPQASVIGQSSVKLAEVALATSLTKSEALTNFLAEECKKPGLGPKEHAALKDCREGMEDTIDQLMQSLKEITAMTKASLDQFSGHKSNLQTWVSSVMSNFNTCVEGFTENSADPKVTETIKPKVAEVEQDTSNALALINQLQGPA